VHAYLLVAYIYIYIYIYGGSTPKLRVRGDDIEMLTADVQYRTEPCQWR
jgi:hypothetical protein